MAAKTTKQWDQADCVGLRRKVTVQGMTSLTVECGRNYWRHVMLGRFGIMLWPRVCLSVHHKQICIALKGLNGSSSFLEHIPYSVITQFWYFHNTDTSCWNFVLNSGLKKNVGTSTVESVVNSVRPTTVASVSH